MEYHLALTSLMTLLLSLAMMSNQSINRHWSYSRLAASSSSSSSDNSARITRISPTGLRRSRFLRTGVGIRAKRASAVEEGVHREESIVERAAHGEHTMRYGILLDAGSSSTKVKVYSYSPGVSPNYVPDIRLLFSDKVKPGLSQLLFYLDKIADYVARCLSQAASHVPGEMQASTPVFVMATAGLRMLPAPEASALLWNVRDAMMNSTINPFYFEEEHVEILSGEEEAVFAWLAANYLHGFFSSAMTRQDSVGLMEMGGGSMQVAFLPGGPLYQEEFQMYVGRRRFDLYAQSYLSFGSRYISTQIRHVLSQNGQYSNGQQLSNPCMLVGDNVKLDTDEGPLLVSGTGNASQCEDVLLQVLHPAGPDLCSPGPCTIGDTYQPAVGSLHFYAISAFLYAPKFLGAVEENDRLNITKLRQKAWQYCTLTVDEAVLQTGTKPRFASNDCMMGLYIPLLLTRSLGFHNQTNSITVTQKINGTDIDWALGAMMQHLSMAFLDDTDRVITCWRGLNTLPLSRESRATQTPGDLHSRSVTFEFSASSILVWALLVLASRFTHHWL